jgi:hypothetical protein
MTHPNTQPTSTARPRTPTRRSRIPTLLTLALLFTIVTTARAGCIVVPWGWGGHGHGREYYRHGYYRGDRW